jgi:hypothetical protein
MRTVAAAIGIALSTPALANPFDFRFNVGVAGSVFKAEDRERFGTESRSEKFTGRPFAGVDAVIGGAIILGAEGELAFDQRIYSSSATSSSIEFSSTFPFTLGTATTSLRSSISESGRGSVRLGYDFGGVIPYVRVGAASIESDFISRRTGFTPYNERIKRSETVGFVGLGLEARYQRFFARVEANLFDVAQQPSPVQFFQPTPPSGGFGYSAVFLPVALDYELRVAAGLTF